jgi:hypothetical protein
MAHALKPDLAFRRNGRVHLNRQGRQFSRLQAAEVCASAVVMLDTPCSEVAWRVLATHSIHQFPLHFPSRASPCAIRFQLDSTYSGVTCNTYFCVGCWSDIWEVTRCVNGSLCRSQIYIVTEFLNMCHYETNLSLCSGIMLHNSDNIVQ